MLSWKKSIIMIVAMVAFFGLMPKTGNAGQYVRSTQYYANTSSSGNTEVELDSGVEGGNLYANAKSTSDAHLEIGSANAWSLVVVTYTHQPDDPNDTAPGGTLYWDSEVWMSVACDGWLYYELDHKGTISSYADGSGTDSEGETCLTMDSGATATYGSMGVGDIIDIVFNQGSLEDGSPCHGVVEQYQAYGCDWTTTYTSDSESKSIDSGVSSFSIVFTANANVGSLAIVTENDPYIESWGETKTTLDWDTSFVSN